MKMKKFAVGLAAISAMSFALYGCNDDGSGSKALQNKNDVYGMSAVTAVKLLDSEFSGEALSRLSSVRRLRSGAVATAADGLASVKAQAEEFNKYVYMLDGFFGDEVVSTTVVENVDEGYAYDYKLTIKGRNVAGEVVTNLMYYSEKMAREEIEDDDDGQEIERSYTLEGVLVMDGVDYPMRGERNEESEADESEAEITIRAYLNAEDEGTYVQVEQETSEELGESEKEYVYSVYQGGRLIEKTAIEFETERSKNAEKAEYEVEFLSGNGRGRYEIKQIKKGSDRYLKVDYALDNQRGSFTVKEVVGENGVAYEYTFSDGSKLTLSGEPVTEEATPSESAPAESAPSEVA